MAGRVTTTSGHELAVETRGSGDPLLLVQGMSGHAGMWGEALLADLARDFEVITYDHRGIGDSSRADTPFSIADLAAMEAADLLAGLGHESAHVMGISMGGMVAQELCLRAPGRVRTAVLGCTSAGGPGAFDAPGPGALLEAMASRDPEIASRVAFEVNVSREFAGRHGELDRFRAASLARRVPVPVIQLQSQACLGHETASRLSDLRLPVTVVHGEEDQMILPAQGRRLVELVPGAAAEFWPGVGHLFWWERPEEAAAVIRRTAAA